MKATLTSKDTIISTESLLIIMGDTNDGDYIHNIITINSREKRKKIEELLERIVPVLEDEHGTWENGDQGNSAETYVEEGKMTQADADRFSELVPHGEYGIHSVEDITLYDVMNKKEY